MYVVVFFYDSEANRIISVAIELCIYKDSVETGFFYINSRYYDPQVGRFLSPDKMENLLTESMSHVNGANLYMYCYNNPVMYTDPSGEGFFTALLIGFLVGAIIGGGVEVGFQIHQNGWNPGDWNWGQIGLSALGGGVAGMIAAIPVPGLAALGWGGKLLSYGMTFALGATGSIAGGYISGYANADNWWMFGLMGGFGNVAARGISAGVNKLVTRAGQNTINHWSNAGLRVSDMVGNKVLARTVGNAMGLFPRSISYSFMNSGIGSLFGWWY